MTKKKTYGFGQPKLIVMRTKWEIQSSTEVKKTTIRSPFLGGLVILEIVISLFTMNLYLSCQYGMDAKNYCPKYGYTDLKDGQTS